MQSCLSFVPALPPYEAFVTLLAQHLNRNPQQRDVQVTVDFDETTDRVVVGPDNSRS